MEDGPYIRDSAQLVLLSTANNRYDGSSVGTEVGQVVGVGITVGTLVEAANGA